jgi:protein-S-isoprenylcysteine O-methyltransferase Ste14
MRVADLVIVVSWVAFWFYWLVAARGAKPSQYQRGGLTGSRVAVAVVTVFLLRAVAFRPHPVHRDPVLTAAGLVLFYLGLAIAIWARLNLGGNWGTPMSRKDEPELVTTGPYRWVRHPIYSGLILAVAGIALAISLWGLIAVAALTGFFAYSATREEAYLTERFPDSYPAYRRSTKMLIPFIF